VLCPILEDGNDLIAESLVYTMYQDIPMEVVQFRKSVKDMTPDAFRTANFEWLKAMERELERLDADETPGPMKGIGVAYYPSNAIERMYSEVAGGQAATIVTGYAVMLTFVVLSQSITREKWKSMGLLGFLGFCFVLIGNAAAYGLIALAGYKYNYTMLQALPFIALGLGVDDLFLLLHAFKDVMREWRGSKPGVVVALTMMEAGSSVTITSVCNACVFFVAAAIIPITGLKDFLIATGTIVCVNFVTAMTLVPAMLSVWAQMFAKKDAMVLTKHEIQFRIQKNFRENVQRTTANMNSKCRFETLKGDPSPETLFELAYACVASSVWLKSAMLLVGAGITVAFVSFIPKVETGYQYTDLAKQGTFLAKGIDMIFDQVYDQHAAERVIFGVGVDYEADQYQLQLTKKRLAESYWSAYSSGVGRSGTFANTWLSNMYSSKGVCPYWNISGDGTDPWYRFYQDYHLWRKPNTLLRDPVTDELLLPSTIATGSLLAGLVDRTQQFAYSINSENYTVHNKIVLAWDDLELDMNKVKTTDDRINMVKDLRKICDDSGINIYMYGWVFIYTEQFLQLDYYFWQACALSMSAVWFVSLLLGMSWFSAAIISLFSVLLCCQVYGSLWVLDIKYQSLAAVSMLMSIGISVEFIAHPVAAFEFSVGTRSERLAQAMAKTAWPVVEGAISSFVGFAFLVASDFKFVQKYFFWIFFMIVLFGSINALIFLPGLLGLFGPNKKKDLLRRNSSILQKASAEANVTDGLTRSMSFVSSKLSIANDFVAQYAATHSPGATRAGSIRSLGSLRSGSFSQELSNPVEPSVEQVELSVSVPPAAEAVAVEAEAVVVEATAVPELAPAVEPTKLPGELSPSVELTVVPRADSPLIHTAVV